VSLAAVSRKTGIAAWQTLLAALLLVIFTGASQAATAAASRQQAANSRPAMSQANYATPEAALAALVAAAEARNRSAMNRIFGPDYDQLLSGDRVQDDNALARFANSLHDSARLQKNADGSYTVLVGKKGWPFPIPVVQQSDRWRFDTKAGLEEILNRRIGEDELSAIATCRAYVVAQWEYYTVSGADHDGLAVYAQRFISRPGTHDGLYWPTASDEKPSPFGDLISSRRAEGYGLRKRNHPKTSATPKPKFALPYHGYYFRILKRQGPNAPGGKFGYVINGNMIAGYALVAYPAKWGNSGVMTFIVNQQGRVYQKNLGPNTEKTVDAMTEYNPDPTWELVGPEP
jgi:hypothetical protein